MESFICDFTTADTVPIAVCGICENGLKNDICSALLAARKIEFGSYRSGFTIDYRLAELIKDILKPFGNAICHVGATVKTGQADCVTGGIFGSVGDEFVSADSALLTTPDFMLGTRPGFMAFAADTYSRKIAALFEEAEGYDGFFKLYNALVDEGCIFAMISDGSGEGAMGMAATDEDIINLSETEHRAKEQRTFFGMKRIGIMGGTFDPVHNGHLIAAETVREKLSLDKVIFIPTGQTSYKNSGVSSGSHRYKMTYLAAKSNRFFTVSSLETEREGIAYTVDTVEEIRKLCDEDAKLYFIIGADVLEYISLWKDFDRLAQMCEFAAVTRPGYNNLGFIGVGKLREHGAKVYFIEAPAMDISSSAIRKAVREGKTVKYLLPEEVEDFVRLHRLYRDNSDNNIDKILKKLT